MKHMSGVSSDGVVNALSAEDTNSLRKNERSSYWDNVKLLLIFLVVLGHFLYSRTDLRPVTLITMAIYTFHMPAFAFVSGYWSKSERSRSFGQLARLGVAYVLFNGIFMLWAAVRGSDVLITYPYYSFWYIIALIVWRLSVGWVAKVPLALPASVVLAFAIGFWVDAGNVFAFGRTIAFYPFFLAGYLMPREWGERLEDIRPLLKVLVGGLILAVGAVAIFLSYRMFHFGEADVMMEPFARQHDAIVRAAIFAIAAIVTVGILVITPDVKVPLLTTIGKNSLVVYLFHRYVVLVYEHAVAPGLSARMLILTALGATLVTMVVLGNQPVATLVNGFLDRASSLITREGKKGFLTLVCKAALVAMCGALTVAPIYAMRHATAVAQADDPLYQRLSAAQEAELDNAYTILFSGDLILLEDQVRNAYTSEGYDFSSLFEYTKPYIESADLAIGVFEGPMAGAEAGYSSGNFDDTKPFWVNFPDEFATAVKDAGFDLVTTANNHLLDRGLDGAMRTLDVLDEAGLTHVGSYRSVEEKRSNALTIVDTGELKVAVLAYTYGVNNGEAADYSDDTFVGGEYAYLTSTIVDPSSSSFAACRSAVESDLAAARDAGCDLIVVLPHWGTQFAFEPDEMQQTWRDIFLEGGADVILGDHTHSVQPLVFSDRDGRMTLTCYCPGNYTNVYRGHDGDASALVEVRVSRDTKQVIGADIIPMWTESALSGNYRPLPVYSILNDETLVSQVSTHDLERVGEVNALITSVMLDERLDLQMARERMMLTPDGFRRGSVPQIEITEDMQSGTLYQALTSAENVCFVGDSITEGTRNGGYGWYEPIESLVSGEVTNVSLGGATVQTLLGMTEGMLEAKADLYVIAVGTNDVRYRDESICAMTPAAYVERLTQLVNEIRAGVPDAQFVFVAPWTSTSGDVNTYLNVNEKREMNAAYTETLKAFCESQGFGFIDPNPAIEAVIDTYPQSDYLVDFIHPNSTAGLELYARTAMGA